MMGVVKGALDHLIYPKETKRTLWETIDLCLSTYRSESYKDRFTQNEGWVKPCDT